ncbi:MAG: type II secretion system protein [Sedimentisphaerales bacterium]|nr:type II secretion system protein [Sedimentisphaerales bacterium]
MSGGRPNAGIAGPGERRRDCVCAGAPDPFNSNHSSINHQQPTINHSNGFTLIELSVVISIIALLMAVLMPCLQRVRQQARAMGCQANLRQWALLYAAYSAENEGYLPPARDYLPYDWAASDWRLCGGIPHARLCMQEGQSLFGFKGIFYCPMALKPMDPSPFNSCGGTFFAWRMYPGSTKVDPSLYWYTSYSANYQALSWEGDRSDLTVSETLRFVWMTATAQNPSAIPVFLDSMYGLVSLYNEKSPPPACDAIPTRAFVGYEDTACHSVCINRHNGGVNSLFLDWSARKVGLKELWTLKWWPGYNSRGPWTKAGGVEPQDWPRWLHGFADY